MRTASMKDIPDEVIAEIVRRYRSGATVRGLAAEYDLSHATLNRRLKALGVYVTGRTYKGTRHHNYKEGQKKIGKYLAILLDDDHPMASMRYSNGYVPVHRLTMAESLGRPLTTEESVHHIDGNILNNDLSNLQLRQGQHGSGVAFECRACGSHDIVATKIKDA